MKRLLLKVHMLDDFADRDGCDKVVLDLDDTREYLLRLKERCSPLFPADNFYCVSFYSYVLAPITAGEIDVMDLDWFDDGADYMVVPNDASLDVAMDFRMESPTIRVMKDGVMWDFAQKGCNIQFETGTVPWDIIEG